MTEKTSISDTSETLSTARNFEGTLAFGSWVYNDMQKLFLGNVEGCVGYWVLHDKLGFYTKRRPNWIQKLSGKFFFGLKWVDDIETPKKLMDEFKAKKA